MKSNLVVHAERELELLGFPTSRPVETEATRQNDEVYQYMIYKATLDLIRKFSAQGHSGHSASIVLGMFYKLAQFQNLKPLTNNPAEWNEVEAGRIWQSQRSSSCFSHDGGKTYYKLEDGWNTWGKITQYFPKSLRVWIFKNFYSSLRKMYTAESYTRIEA